jgi:hypothetical protein
MLRMIIHSSFTLLKAPKLLVASIAVRLGLGAYRVQRIHLAFVSAVPKVPSLAVMAPRKRTAKTNCRLEPRSHHLAADHDVRLYSSRCTVSSRLILSHIQDAPSVRFTTTTTTQQRPDRIDKQTYIKPRPNSITMLVATFAFSKPPSPQAYQTITIPNPPHALNPAKPSYRR